MDIKTYRAALEAFLITMPQYQQAFRDAIPPDEMHKCFPIFEKTLRDTFGQVVEIVGNNARAAAIALAFYSAGALGVAETLNNTLNKD